jgi:hypothetical protein
MFENSKLAELTADDIETYFRGRLKQRAIVKTKDGFVEKHVLKATTVSAVASAPPRVERSSA